MELQLLLLFLEVFFDSAPLDTHFLKFLAQFPNFIGSVQQAGGLLPDSPLELFDTPTEGLNRSHQNPHAPDPQPDRGSQGQQQGQGHLLSQGLQGS